MTLYRITTLCQGAVSALEMARMLPDYADEALRLAIGACEAAVDDLTCNNLPASAENRLCVTLERLKDAKAAGTPPTPTMLEDCACTLHRVAAIAITTEHNQ